MRSHRARWAGLALAVSLSFPLPAAAAQTPDTTPLAVGTPVERELKGGETHVYVVQLAARDLLDAVIEQKGVDVVVTLVAPDGTKLLEVDSPNGERGPEPLRYVAPVTGEYRIEVRSLEPTAAPGRYVARLVEIRTATDLERRNVEAVSLEAEAERVSGERPDEARGLKLRAMAMLESAFDPAVPLNGLLAADQAVAYRIHLAEGEFLALRVERRDTNLALTLIGPDGRQLFRAENPILGIDAIAVVAGAAGNHWLEVRRLGSDTRSGQYAVSVSALRPATKTDQAVAEAFRLETEASALEDAKRFDEAASAMQRSIAAREQALGPEHKSLAYAYGHLATIYNSAGIETYGPNDIHAKATAAEEHGLAILEKADGPDAPSLIPFLVNLGGSLGDAGHYEKAKVHYRRVIAVVEKQYGPEAVRLGYLLWDLGHRAYDAGDYLEAEAEFKRAVAIFEKAGSESKATAEVTNYLGSVYSQMGDYPKAEALRLRALAIVEKLEGPESSSVAGKLNNLGDVYHHRGDLDNAEANYRRALAIWEKAEGPSTYDVSFAVLGLGSVAVARGRYDEAEAYFRRVAAIYDLLLPHDHPQRAHLYVELADLYRRTGRYAEAEVECREVLRLDEQRWGKGHPSTARALATLAGVYRESGRSAEALATYRQALDLQERGLGPTHPDVAATLQNLVELSWSAGDSQATRSLLARLADAREHAIARDLAVGSDRQRLLYLELSKHDLDLLVSYDMLSAPSDTDVTRLALEGALRRKGRATDATAESSAAAYRRASPDVRALLDELAAARGQLAGLTYRGPGAEGADAYRAALERADHRVDELEQQLGARDAESRMRFRPATVDAVRGAIPPGARLVEYVEYHAYDAKADVYGTRRYAAYVLSPDGAIGRVDLGEAEPIDRLAGELRAAVRAPGRDAGKAARSLDEAVLRPVRRLVDDATQLLVSPDGALNLVAFGALVDESGRYAVERYDLSYLTSGRDLLRLGEHKESRSVSFVVGAPDFGNAAVAETGTRAIALERLRFNALVGANAEVRALAALLLGARTLMGAAATEPAVKSVVAPQILHVATHGFFLDEAARATDDEKSLDFARRGGANVAEATAGIRTASPLLRSGLALAGANRRDGGGGEDGILTALEASGLDLWGTRLVVLSACDTGLGEVRAGEGVYGLRRALVLAGSETQVMSLWAVDDRATRELMVAYYKQLLSGAGRAEAMRRVQLAMLKDPKRRHPAYWASFIVSGDWRPLR
jgi:CHAT domain-containing protein/tetratricopeptide (TPR) repeat protein